MNKRMFALLISLASSLLVGAQEVVGYYSSDKIVREACINACVIVEQTYQLKEVKTGNIYGLNGHEEFGAVVSLGVATADGLVVGPQATSPWNYDLNYDTYRKDDRYEPVLYETSVKPVGEKGFVNFNCPNDTLEGFGAYHSIIRCNLSSRGLCLSDTTGKLDGWMIWAMYHVTDELAKETEYKVMVNYFMDVEVGNEAFKVDPPKNNYRAIGGFLVVPHITMVGSVTFELCGIARKEGDKWLLSPIQKLQNEPKPEEPQQPKQIEGKGEETPNPSGGRLTRVRKGKKGNK